MSCLILKIFAIAYMFFWIVFAKYKFFASSPGMSCLGQRNTPGKWFLKATGNCCAAPSISKFSSERSGVYLRDPPLQVSWTVKPICCCKTGMRRVEATSTMHLHLPIWEITTLDYAPWSEILLTPCRSSVMRLTCRMVHRLPHRLWRQLSMHVHTLPTLACLTTQWLIDGLCLSSALWVPFMSKNVKYKYITYLL